MVQPLRQNFTGHGNTYGCHRAGISTGAARASCIRLRPQRAIGPRFSTNRDCARPRGRAFEFSTTQAKLGGAFLMMVESRTLCISLDRGTEKALRLSFFFVKIGLADGTLTAPSYK